MRSTVTKNTTTVKVTRTILQHPECLGLHIPEGYVVAHTCHNPECVNPNHLGICTQSENILMSVEVGRVKLPYQYIETEVSYLIMVTKAKASRIKPCAKCQ